MTNEEFDNAVWRKGDRVKVAACEEPGRTGEVVQVSFDTRMISILISFGRIRHYHCCRCERVEKHTPTEQLSEEKVHQIINRSMWDNECPNPDQSNIQS